MDVPSFCRVVHRKLIKRIAKAYPRRLTHVAGANNSCIASHASLVISRPVRCSHQTQCNGVAFFCGIVFLCYPAVALHVAQSHFQIHFETATTRRAQFRQRFPMMTQKLFTACADCVQRSTFFFGMHVCDSRIRWSICFKDKFVLHLHTVIRVGQTCTSCHACTCESASSRACVHISMARKSANLWDLFSNVAGNTLRDFPAGRALPRQAQWRQRLLF